MEEREDDFNRDFVINLLKKIDWKAFKSGATDVRESLLNDQIDWLYNP